ncbi:MAG: hypothetical protein QW727_03425 [Candidatus Pacearchaeota archaeon]
MKKEGFFLLVVILVLSGVIAQEVTKEVDENTEKFIKDFVKKEGINESEISDILVVNQSELPENIDIKNIDENKVGIYEVNYTQANESKKIFVLTYATTQFAKKEQIYTKNIQNLYFGYSGESEKSGFLSTSSGVITSKDKGYVMLREGSVTGISTSADISGDGKIFISIYKNGKDVGFHNIISSADYKKIDYDLQSEDIVTYSPGDVISVFVQVSGKVNWGDATTIVETTS